MIEESKKISMKNVGQKQNYEEDLKKAIHESTNNKKNAQLIQNEFDGEMEYRKEGAFCGLKNINNTCYFNSLLYIVMHNERFFSKVMGAKVSAEFLGAKLGNKIL